MNTNTIVQVKKHLENIIESYEQLKKMELYGGKKEQLRNELIKIRDFCDEIPSLVGIIATELNLEIDKIGSWVGFLKTDFLNTLKIQIILLSEPLTPDNDSTIKLQASMSVAFMNDYIQGCKLIYTILTSTAGQQSEEST